MHKQIKTDMHTLFPFKSYLKDRTAYTQALTHLHTL